MAKALYNQLAQYYELLANRNFHSEANFISAVIKRHDKNSNSILDLGCGVGSHLKFLSKLNYGLVGLDISVNMLGEAFKNAPNATYINGDFRNFDLKDKTDSAICMGTSFNYLLTNDEFIEFRNSIYRNINGILMLDTRNFENKNNLREITNSHLIYENDQVKFNSTRSIYFKNGYRYMNFYHKLFHKETGKTEEFSDEAIGKLFTLDSMNSLLKERFKMIGAYGDYNSNNIYSKTSSRLIAVYRKI